MRLVECADRFLQPPVSLVLGETRVGVVSVGIGQQLRERIAPVESQTVANTAGSVSAPARCNSSVRSCRRRSGWCRPSGIAGRAAAPGYGLRLRCTAGFVKFGYGTWMPAATAAADVMLEFSRLIACVGPYWADQLVHDRHRHLVDVHNPALQVRAHDAVVIRFEDRACESCRWIEKVQLSFTGARVASCPASNPRSRCSRTPD